MWYRPAIAVKWNAVSEAADQKYLDTDRSMALEPIYDLMMRIPLPVTRQDLESYLQEVFTWLKANKHPFGDDEVWLETIYIVIRDDDELVVEMEVDDQQWQITQCMV